MKTNIIYNFLNTAKRLCLQFLRTFYSAHPLGAVNESSLLISNSTYQYLPLRLTNRISKPSYQYAGMAIAFTSTISVLWFTSSLFLLLNTEIFGFLAVQAIFMRNFINKLYDKQQEKDSSAGLNILLTLYIYFFQQENFTRLLYLMLFNKSVFTLANPVKRDLVPMRHEQENHMHFVSIIFLLGQQQAWLAKTGQWLNRSFSQGFSVISFLMWLMNQSAKQATDHKNITIGWFALFINALAIFPIKATLSSWNKMPDKLSDKQLRIFYLLSFTASYYAFCYGNAFLDDLMKAAYDCMPESWGRDSLEPMQFHLHPQWSINFSGDIQFNASIYWSNRSPLLPINNTAASSTTCNLESSPHRMSTLNSLFNIFTQNHHNTNCNIPDSIPAQPPL